MAIGISDILAIANFVIGLFNQPTTTQQCIEPTREPQQTATTVYSTIIKPDDDTACAGVSQRDMDLIINHLHQAYEGRKTKSELCKSFIEGKELEKSVSEKEQITMNLLEKYR